MPVVYINRDEDTDRRQYMESQFETVGITNYTRFSAFTGDLKDADPGFKQELLNVKNIPESVKNIYRAITSHLLVIRSLEFNESPYALILEDDVVLTTCLNWNFSFKEFCDSLPNDWDAVQLYLNPRVKGEPVSLGLRPYSKKHISTLAYLITKERAAEICNQWFRVGVPDISKAHTVLMSPLTDDVVYTPKSYGVNLFSTEEFVSTILTKVPEKFHENSREVIRLWEEESFSLEKLLKGPYIETVR